MEQSQGEGAVCVQRDASLGGTPGNAEQDGGGREKENNTNRSHLSTPWYSFQTRISTSFVQALNSIDLEKKTINGKANICDISKYDTANHRSVT